MRKGDFTMIYFDNAATTRRKPQEVVQAVTEALCSLGNAGRGAHEATLQASRTIYDTRRKLAEFFHAENPEWMVFTSNATESLNIVIKGLLNPGDHVITTQLEHNSVLRPLYEMEEKGVELTIVKADAQGRFSLENMEAAIRPGDKSHHLYPWIQCHRKSGGHCSNRRTDAKARNPFRGGCVTDRRGISYRCAGNAY